MLSLLDFSNAVQLPKTPNNVTYIATKTGAIIGAFGGASGYYAQLFINDKQVALRNDNVNNHVEIYGVKVGDIIKLTFNGNGVANMPQFIPFKS